MVKFNDRAIVDSYVKKDNAGTEFRKVCLVRDAEAFATEDVDNAPESDEIFWVVGCQRFVLEECRDGYPAS